MFEKEDIILYGVHGVCKITELVEREYGGVSKQYYVLKPMYNDNTSILYVPVDSQALVSKMKRVLSAEEIYALIRSMPKEQAIWIEDERERKARYKEILEHLILKIQRDNGRKLDSLEKPERTSYFPRFFECFC